MSDPLASYCVKDKVSRAFKSLLTKKGKDAYTVSVKYTRVYSLRDGQKTQAHEKAPKPESKSELLFREDFPMARQNIDQSDCAGKVKENRAWKREIWCWYTEAPPRR